MRACRDSFLHLIADNLVDASAVAIPVHNVRTTPDDPQAALIQENTVNVEYLNADDGSSTKASQQVVEINVVNDDELVAVDWVRQVADILHSGECPKLDYTNPSSPVAVGTNLWWDPFLFKFVRIKDGTHARYKCVFTILHRSQ